MVEQELEFVLGFPLETAYLKFEVTDSLTKFFGYSNMA
jgi:hypothetical protein